MKNDTFAPYDRLSKAFHWVTAIMVGIAFILGPGDFGRLLDEGIDPATRIDILWHESLGVTVFMLTLLRLSWVAVRPAAPRIQMKSSMHVLARLMHIALWGLLFALPLTALLALGSQAIPLTLLGGVRIDRLPFIAGSYGAGLADWGDLHKLLGDAIIWLAGVHALAALYHHFKLKDGVLSSMLP